MAHLISVQIAFHGMDLRIQFSNHLGYKGLTALAVGNTMERGWKHDGNR